jgi:hypothetical protein
MYRFEHPARGGRLSRVVYTVCLVMGLLAVGFVLLSALYVRDWLQGLFLLLALTS